MSAASSEAASMVMPRASSMMRAMVSLLLGTIVLVLIPALLNGAFYYDDDVRHYFMPQVMDVGTRLGQGEMPWITIRSWFAGNYAGEGVLSLFNPINLGLYWLCARAGDPETAALIFSGTYLYLTALGVYFLARTYGAARSWAVVSALAYCSSAFVMYWWAPTWWNALVGICWMIWAWAGWRCFIREGRRGMVAFVGTYFLLVSGWPHGAIMGSLIVLVEMIFARKCFVLPSPSTERSSQGMPPHAILNLAKLSGILLLAACAVGTSLLSNYPAYLHATESARSAWGLTGGSNWVGSLDYLVAAGWPSFLGSSEVFFGGKPTFPSFYLAWFVPPALLLLFWRHHRASTLQDVLPLLTIAALALLMSLGPQQAFFLRWPLRFLTFGHIALLIAACLVLQNFDLRMRSSRLTFGGYALLGVLTSCLIAPDAWLIHVSLGAIAILGSHLMASKPADGWHRAAAAGSFIVLIHLLTHMLWPQNDNVGHWPVPEGAFATDPESLTGNSRVTLMKNEHPCDRDACPLASGNIGLWEHGRSLNGYSPTGARPFHSLLGFGIWSWTSSTSPDLLALTPYLITDGTTKKRRFELMRINEFRIASTVQPQRFESLVPGNWKEQPLPFGSIFRAAEPVSELPGTVSWVSTGVRLEGENLLSSQEERLTVLENDVDSEFSRIIFARAWNPGYEATLDGQRLEVEKYGSFLVSVLIPARQTGSLRLYYRPPGIRWTGPLALMCVILAAFIIIRTRRVVGE